MKFETTLVHGYLLKRYKRFLSDVKLDDGSVVTAHCTNSGSMKSCLEEGAEVYISPAGDQKRKTRFTWEMIRIGSDWVGINTSRPNELAFEWLKEGRVPGLEGLSNLRREVKWEDSRFDLYGEEDTGIPLNYRGCFVEVKNVTLKDGKFALFPDAVTTRGRKHLNTLIRVKEAGMRAVMLFVVQRMDVEVFAPAREIDPEYSRTLEEARNRGVEIFAARARVTPEHITYDRLLEVEI